MKWLDQSIIAAATYYRARCGMRRPFTTEAGALQYEAGYAAFKDGRSVALDSTSAFVDGWLDAEREDEFAADESEYQNYGGTD